MKIEQVAEDMAKLGELCVLRYMGMGMSEELALSIVSEHFDFFNMGRAAEREIDKE